MPELQNHLLDKINPSSISWETMAVAENCCSSIINTSIGFLNRLRYLADLPLTGCTLNLEYSVQPTKCLRDYIFLLFCLWKVSHIMFVLGKIDHSPFDMCDIITQKYNWSSHCRLWDSLCKKHDLMPRNVLCSITLL